MSAVYYDNINGFSQLKMENGKLYGRLNSGEWQEIETGGEQGEPGADGVSAYVYWAWCADPATGAGFSLTNPADYISFITRNTVLVSPQFSDFTVWVKYVGANGKNGADGVSTYVYYAYASNADGTNFSLSPADNLIYQAILVTHTEIASPSLSDFAGMFYQYKADKTELENYLPLSGGTMTGSLLTTNENSFMFENTTGKIGILFNSSWTNGASIWLHGKDHAQAGCFDINAHNGTTSCQLKGKADGTLKWTGGVLSGDGSSSGLLLYAGANNFDGATLQMFKRNHGTYAGQFYLRASTKSSSGDTTSGVKSCDLVGKPDGTLTWGGKNVLTTGNTTYVTAAWKSGRNWYIKWSNGLIQQGGRATITNGTATKVTFHTAFTSSNVSVVITPVKSTSNTYEAVVTGNTASNFTAFGYDTTINWIATGY